jgi:endo-1,4-beta-xylanase
MGQTGEIRPLATTRTGTLVLCGFLLMQGLTWLVLAGPARAVVDVDCARPESDCTLAETADQAGVWIGAAVASPDRQSERATVPTHFSSVTTENALKWGALAPRLGEYDFSQADALVDFAAQAGVRMRGHTLLWGRLQLPADLESTVANAPDPPATLRALIDAHFRTVVPRYRGKVAVWDVVNEPFDVNSANLAPNVFSRTLGEVYIDEAFHLARELDPDAHLVLNEFFFFYSQGKARGFVDLVRRLLERGVPLDGVGIQGHFDGFLGIPPPSREEFEGFIHDLADLGVSVEITELDVSVFLFRGDPDPWARQAELYGELVAACMAVSACQAVTTWGIDDSNTWLDSFPPFDQVAPHEPLLFDTDLVPKPAYFAVRDAIRGREGSFASRVARLLVSFDESAALGSLAGVGPGASASNRLDVVRKGLVRAQARLQRDRFSVACRELDRVMRRLDPGSGAGAFATGGAVAALIRELELLGDQLQCQGE